MKKKIVVITSAISTLILGSTATMFFAFNGVNSELRGQDEVNNYSVDLHIDSASIQYNDGDGYYYFDAKGEFEVGNIKYEIATEDGLTCFYSGIEQQPYVLDDSYFIEFPVGSYFDITLFVPVISRATVDLNNSKIVAHEKNTSTYFSEKFALHSEDTEAGITYYKVNINGYSHYADCIIDYVRLVFSCVA